MNVCLQLNQLHILVLSWREHVHNISAKATRVLNFIRRNIYHCTSEVKALAYTSLIRPHLEYASAAWDTYTARDSHQFSLTKCSVGQHGSSKEITGRLHQYQNLSLELRWQSLEDRRKNARLSLFYKGLHGLAAIPVNELQHPTRCTRYCGTDTFTVMSSRIDAYKFSFLPRTVTDWNALPPSTKTKQSTDSFKKALYKLPDDSTYDC